MIKLITTRIKKTDVSIFRFLKNTRDIHDLNVLAGNLQEGGVGCFSAFASCQILYKRRSQSIANGCSICILGEDRGLI